MDNVNAPTSQKAPTVNSAKIFIMTFPGDLLLEEIQILAKVKFHISNMLQTLTLC